MTVDACRGFDSSLNCLGVKTEVVGIVGIGVKLGAAQIRQSLTRSMTTLTVEFWPDRFSR